jgi:hypothetical protein
MMTANESRALGFIVDDTCYPWLAYKGPRFSPTEKQEVLTDTEAQLRDALRNAGIPGIHPDFIEGRKEALEACEKPASMRPDAIRSRPG